MEILKYIRARKHDPNSAPVGTFNYFEMKPVEGKVDGMSQLGISLAQQVYQLSHFSIGVEYNAFAQETVKQYGIDADLHLKNILIQQTRNSIQDLIVKEITQLGEKNWHPKLTWFERFVNWITRQKPSLKLKKLETEQVTQLSLEILKCSNQIKRATRTAQRMFVIVSPRIATVLYESTSTNPSSSNFLRGAELYFDGRLPFGVDVLVDPNMSWKNQKLIVGATADDFGGIHYVYSTDLDAPSDEDFTIATNETTYASKMYFRPKLAVVPVGAADIMYVTVPVKFPQPSFWQKLKDKFRKKISF